MTKSAASQDETRELPLKAGGQARLIEADLEFATIEISTPSPPGSTLLLLVAGAPLGLKVRSCRKVFDGELASYQVNGRFVSLSRSQRVALGLEQRPQSADAPHRNDPK